MLKFSDEELEIDIVNKLSLEHRIKILCSKATEKLNRSKRMVNFMVKEMFLFQSIIILLFWMF